MFKKISSLKDVQLLNKKQQKQINGGFFTCFNDCYQNGVQEGDCCIFQGYPAGLGFCQGFQCIAL